MNYTLCNSFLEKLFYYTSIVIFTLGIVPKVYTYLPFSVNISICLFMLMLIVYI